MNIFEALREDHDRQRKLLEELISTSGATEERQSAFQALKRELEAHAEAEERHFYIPLIESDLTQEKARHSIAEHHEIDELIETLMETEQDSSAWLKYARNLKEKVEHHLDEEEQEVFQLAGKTLNEAQKNSLAKEYREYMKENR